MTGLWTPGQGVSLFGPRRYLRRERIEVRDGKRVNVINEDGGIVTHIEEDHCLHAIVRPKLIVARRRKES